MKTTSSYFQKYKEIEIIGRGSFGTANLVQSSEDGMEYIAKKVVLGSLTQKEVDSAQLEVLSCFLSRSNFFTKGSTSQRTQPSKYCSI